jgi:hypothetical protein
MSRAHCCPPLSVFIQFGDAYHYDMAYYSGQFHAQGFTWTVREASRVVYLDETDTLKLAYCNSEAAWTISFKSASSPCEYLFKSEETGTFDVAEVSGASWFVNRELGDVPVDWLKLFCNDCNEEICKPEHGTCIRDDRKGSSVNKCVCHETLGWNDSRPVGVNCDLVAECHFFAPDKRTTGSLSAIAGAALLESAEFSDIGIVHDDNGTMTHLDNTIMMHHRPIYVDGRNISAFMMFTGRRWVIFTSQASKQSNQTIEREEFKRFLRENDSANKPVQTLKNIVQMYSNFEPLFFTTPMNFGEEAYERQDGINWVLTEKAEDATVLSRHADDSQQLPVRFLCSDCVSYKKWHLPCLYCVNVSQM